MVTVMVYGFPQVSAIFRKNNRLGIMQQQVSIYLKWATGCPSEIESQQLRPSQSFPNLKRKGNGTLH